MATASRMALSEIPDFPIVGRNWKDNAEDATQVLRLTGDPYETNGYDPDNSVGIDWGVYGAPETFVVETFRLGYQHLMKSART